MDDLNEFHAHPWAEALKDSAADIAAGRIVPLAPILKELRATAERLEARLAARKTS
jgi:hypothetical protein